MEKTIPIQPLEEVDLEQEVNIESLFMDDDTPEDTTDFTKEDKIIVEEVKPTDINEIKHKVKADEEKMKAGLNISPSDNTFTDHSIRRSVINRRPYVRNPITSFRKDEEYSDFLKKTKSLFYRIKWSLFKD